ncbi:MAG TPA: HD-GYP domain-containing protein [Candidatus Dormibacteraeota bacterium]
MVSLTAFQRAVAAKDVSTERHVERVGILARSLGRAAGVRGLDLENLVSGALLHDVGKLYVPDSILGKRGPLTLEEQVVMQSHTTRGEAMLRSEGASVEIMAVARSHHEWWNGTGYPDRLAGFEIPFVARLVAVCDGFDAMTSERPYRAPLSVVQALEILEEGAGSQWDAGLVELFLGSSLRALGAIAVA